MSEKIDLRELPEPALTESPKILPEPEADNVPTNVKAGTEDSSASKLDATPFEPNMSVMMKRVAALSDGDENERRALEEEKLLSERKAAEKLNRAATKKLEEIGGKPKKKKLAKEEAALERARQEREGLIYERDLAKIKTAEELEHERARSVGEWLNRHKRAVFSFVGLGAVGLIVWASYQSVYSSRKGKASSLLSKAVSMQFASIRDEKKDRRDDAEGGLEEGFKFASLKDKQEAALAEFRNVSASYSSLPAGIIAKLSEAALLLDKRDPSAFFLFQEVKNSELSKTNLYIQARAIEGAGMALEQKPDLDGALRQYKELERINLKGSRELALFHQARLLESRGDKTLAKDLYMQAREKLNERDGQLIYLRSQIDDRLRALDPSYLPKADMASIDDILRQSDLAKEASTPEQMKVMREQVQKMIEESKKKNSPNEITEQLDAGRGSP